MNPTREHWMVHSTMDTADPNLLAEDERGDLWVPSLNHRGWWDRRFNPHNPAHWRYWLRSRRLMRVAMIETSHEVPA